MNLFLIAAGIAAVSVAAAPAFGQGDGALPEPASGQTLGTADLIDTTGTRIGTAAFVETPNSVLIQLRVDRIPAGGYALHIHETGRCDLPSFESAGGHHNPTGTRHGDLNPAGPHAGDLPNIFAASDGPLQVDLLTDRVTLGPGGTGLFPEGGTALVIHAGVDDYLTDPSGNAGSRIACGVIERQTRS